MSQEQISRNILNVVSVLLMTFCLSFAINSFTYAQQESPKRNAVTQKTIEIIGEANQDLNDADSVQQQPQTVAQENVQLTNEAIPNTGPAETATAVIGIIAVGISAKYLMRSRFQLKSSLIGTK